MLFPTGSGRTVWTGIGVGGGTYIVFTGVGMTAGRSGGTGVQLHVSGGVWAVCVGCGRGVGGTSVGGTGVAGGGFGVLVAGGGGGDTGVEVDTGGTSFPVGGVSRFGGAIGNPG